MGEGRMVVDAAAALRRHRLGIRMLTVSFGSAVRSARRDLESSAAEREALIEIWRAWTLSALDRYVDEISRLAERDGRRDDELAAHLLAELENARREVRGA